jgi:hypothetical protein
LPSKENERGNTSYINPERSHSEALGVSVEVADSDKFTAGAASCAVAMRLRVITSKVVVSSKFRRQTVRKVFSLYLS